MTPWPDTVAEPMLRGHYGARVNDMGLRTRRWRLRLPGLVVGAVAVALLVTGVGGGTAWTLLPGLLLLVSAVLVVWLSLWLPPVVPRPGPRQRQALVVLLTSLLTFAVGASVMAAAVRDAVAEQSARVSMADPPEGRWFVVQEGEPVQLAPGTSVSVTLADGDGPLRARVTVDGGAGTVDQALEVGDSVELGALGRLTLIGLEPTHDWTGVRVDGCVADLVLTAPDA